MTPNTLRTLIGFVRSFLERRTPLQSKSDSLSDIYNYLRIDGLYSTSGQPSEDQFSVIHREGFETVINLAPTSMLENSIINEREVLESLEIDYIHIPVDFKNPTDNDFQQFTQALEGKALAKVWVHCAANMRVSAFSYRYRCEVLGEDETLAKRDLDEIWEPMGVWKRFLGFER